MSGIMHVLEDDPIMDSSDSKLTKFYAKIEYTNRISRVQVMSVKCVTEMVGWILFSTFMQISPLQKRQSRDSEH